VEFSANLYVLAPKAPARGNGAALFDVLNRGRKNVLRDFNRAAQLADPTVEADYGDSPCRATTTATGRQTSAYFAPSPARLVHLAVGHPDGLHHDVGRDPERLARFEREAKTLASLNHPNIAHIHGLEESGGVRALVMDSECC
jgi:hypothetical protein